MILSLQILKKDKIFRLRTSYCFIWLFHDVLLCHIIIEQFTSVEQHIGGLLTAVPPLVNACEEFLTISHDINNK